MVLGFGKSKDGESDKDDSFDSSGLGSPSGEVRRLASQGYSEMEIINELKSMGYPNDRIERSMNKVLKNKVSSSTGESQVARRSPKLDEEAPADRSEPANDFSENTFVAPQPSSSFSNQGGGQRGSRTPPSPQTEAFMTEEEEIELEILVEEIIDEKWSNVEKDLEKFMEGREEIVAEIEDLRDEIDSIKERQDDNLEEIEYDIDDVSSRLEGIGSRVSSLEKAFKEFLPKITKNKRRDNESSDDEEYSDGHRESVE